MTQQDDYLVDAILCHKDLAEQGQADCKVGKSTTGLVQLNKGKR